MTPYEHAALLDWAKARSLSTAEDLTDRAITVAQMNRRRWAAELILGHVRHNDSAVDVRARLESLFRNA